MLTRWGRGKPHTRLAAPVGLGLALVFVIGGGVLLALGSGYVGGTLVLLATLIGIDHRRSDRAPGAAVA